MGQLRLYEKDKNFPLKIKIILPFKKPVNDTVYSW